MKIKSKVFNEIRPLPMYHYGQRFYFVPYDSLLSDVLHRYWDELSQRFGINPEHLINDMIPYFTHSSHGFCFASNGSDLESLDVSLFGGNGDKRAVSIFLAKANLYTRDIDKSQLGQLGIKY